jgi:hypothetical protein
LPVLGRDAREREGLMNIMSTGHFEGSEVVLWIHVIIHLSKPTECAAQRMVFVWSLVKNNASI